MKDVLKCPNCHQSLFKVDRSYKCKNNHSFDMSKKGYIHLLLANQKHSDISGDSKFMIDARNRFLDSEAYSILKEELASIITSFYHPGFVFGDMACGEGYYTTYIHQELEKLGDVSTYGVDLSLEAIAQSSRRQRLLNQTNNSLYVIGNLSFLPFMDSSFDLLLNCFAKLEEKEFARVLKPSGVFIRVLPGEKHLYGLKKVVYDNVYLNEEKEMDLKGFSLIETRNISKEVTLSNQQIKDVFTMTPYYYKSPKEGVERLYSLNELTTEISFLILVYKKI